MKNLFYLLLVLGLLSCTPDNSSSQSSNSGYREDIIFDSAMAAETGADSYGMRQYVLAYLKKGPNRPEDSVKAAELQSAHMANIVRLAEEGKLVLAGPFMDDGDIRGLYIFAVESIEEAKKLTETDPAIKAGSLVMELHPWYGSAALMRINELHTKISKKSI